MLIGSGGREHALAWKLAQSPRLTKLWAAPGNPGISAHAALAALDPADHAAVLAGYAAYGRKAADAMGDVDSRQAIGSSYAFYDSLTPAQLSAASEMCLKAVDGDFAEDDWW